MSLSLGDLAGILGGVGQLTGAILGNNNQSTAVSNQQALSGEALQLAKDQFGFNRDTTNKILQAAYAPTTDARGTQTGYDPATGFFTNLSPSSKQLLSSSDSEQLAQMLHDLPLARGERDVNASRRAAESQSAASLLPAVTGPSQYSLSGMQDNLEQQAVQKLNDAYRDEQGRVESQALRSGTSGGAIIEALMKQRGRDTNEAITNAAVAAPQAYEAARSSEQGRNLNAYNTMATRASNIDNPSFAPSSIGSTNPSVSPIIAGGQSAAQLGFGGLSGLNAATNSGFDANKLLTQLGSPATSIGASLGGLGALLNKSSGSGGTGGQLQNGSATLG